MDPIENVFEADFKFERCLFLSLHVSILLNKEE